MLPAARRELAEVLKAARELLARPDNDFSWSSWGGAGAALEEIDGLIALIDRGVLPKRIQVTVLFAPTGPIQEVSLSSGWGEAFLEVSRRLDAALERVYGQATG